MKNILVIGESHHGTHLKTIKGIFDDLSHLDKIFIELPISHQNSVDSYLETSNLDDILNKTFKGALKEGNNIKDTILFILDFARKHNISVFCIDSSKFQTDEFNKVSSHGRWFLRGESRDEDMFNNFVENYDKNEKVIVVCGANHLVDSLHFRTGLETFGTKLKNKFGGGLEKIILK